MIKITLPIRQIGAYILGQVVWFWLLDSPCTHTHTHTRILVGGYRSSYTVVNNFAIFLGTVVGFSKSGLMCIDIDI